MPRPSKFICKSPPANGLVFKDETFGEGLRFHKVRSRVLTLGSPPARRRRNAREPAARLPLSPRVKAQPEGSRLRPGENSH